MLVKNPKANHPLPINFGQHVVPYKDRSDACHMNTEPKLTASQIKQLANIVSEMLDKQSITREQVDDRCCLLFEDIAGLELLTDTEKQETIDEIWKYITD